MLSQAYMTIAQLIIIYCKIIRRFGMTNKGSESSSFRSPEPTSLQMSLLGPRTSREHRQRQIDVKRLVNNQQQARVTTINLNAYRPYEHKLKQNSPAKSYQSPNFRSEEDEENESPQPIGSAQLIKVPRISRTSEHESFITSYESNHVIGTLIYLLFLAFLAAQVMGSSYAATEPKESPRFYIERTLIVVLCSQILCYVSMRYLNGKAEKKFLKKTTMLGSLKKVIVPPRQTNNSTSFRIHYGCLVLLVCCSMGGEIIYCSMLSRSNWANNGEDGFYLVASIFWIQWGVPFLFEHFYISESSYHPKVRLVGYIVIALLLAGTFLEGFQSLLLALFNLAYIFIYTKQGFEMFHLTYLIKGILLVFTFIWTLIKYQSEQSEPHLVSTAFYSLLLIILLTACMLVTRVLGLNYLKQELLKNFYTQPHLQIGFVLVAMFMYLVSVIMRGLEVWPVMALVLLGASGVLIYLQGRQKMQVHMDWTNEDL